jgi:hypothetical protein
MRNAVLTVYLSTTKADIVEIARQWLTSVTFTVKGPAGKFERNRNEMPDKK